MTPDIFDTLRALPTGSGGEIQLADALNLHAQAGLIESIELKAKDLTAGRLMDLCLRLRTNMQKDWGNKLVLFIMYFALRVMDFNMIISTRY